MSEAGISAGEPAAAGRLHLMVGTPCFGGVVTDHYTLSLLGLQRACAKAAIDLSFCLLHNDALITRARNSVVAEFLNTPGATHLLFVDADIGFDPDQVFRLLTADKDVVGGAYPIKRYDWPRVARDLSDGVPEAPASALDYVVEYLDPAHIVPVNGFAPARYLGTGFLLIRREVFLTMAERCPELAYQRTHATVDDGLGNLYAFFDTAIDREAGVYLSEDFVFCRRWLSLGGELWVDLESRLNHIGREVFSGSLLASLVPHPR